MNTTPLSHPGKRALVLGGGGAAGNGWEIGLIAGLADNGLDITDADLIIGTSAGASAAVQITTTNPADLLAAARKAPSRSAPTSFPTTTLDRNTALVADATDPADMRRKLAAAALQLPPSPDRRALVAGRLPTQDWPDRTILIVAVDADTGDEAVFTRDSGVPLADAVTASTSGPGAAPHVFGTHRYLDGGYRNNENADLATGYERVLVLSPFGGRSRTPASWRMHLAAQAEDLRANGSRVEIIVPASGILHDANTRDVMSMAVAHPSAWLPSAESGYTQGQALAETLTTFWR